MSVVTVEPGRLDRGVPCGTGATVVVMIAGDGGTPEGESARVLIGEGRVGVMCKDVIRDSISGFSSRRCAGGTWDGIAGSCI